MALLIREDKGAICYLTMNAPEKLNALSDDMIAAFQTQIDALANDTSIRVVVISGAGKVFCAGHDLKEMQRGRDAVDGGAAYFADLFNRCAAMMMSLRALPQVVIAKAHGIATAAGCQMVATCDLAIAEEGTRFGVNGVNIGLFCSTPMVALSRNIHRKKAFEMLTTGQFADAAKAEQMGLINQIAPIGSLDAQVDEMAQLIASKLGSAVRIGKSAFYDQLEMDLAAAYEFTGQVMVQNMLNRDTNEGINAFIEKRDPDWADK